MNFTDDEQINVLKNFLKKIEFMSDSEIGKYFVDISTVDTLTSEILFSVFQENEELMEDIRPLIRQKFLRFIRDKEGLIDLKKLDLYLSQNPNIFKWDPNLKEEIENVKKAQIKYENLRQEITRNIERPLIKPFEILCSLILAIVGFFITSSFYLGGGIIVIGLIRALHVYHFRKSYRDVIIKSQFKKVQLD